MLPILQIGPLAIQTPGLILLAGLWIGLSLSERYASLRNVDRNDLYTLTFVMLISGLAGARLGYAALYAQSFIESPASLFSLNWGLLDTWSGLAVGLIAGAIYIQKKQMAFWNVCDAFIPLGGVILITKSMANLASGNGYGAPVDLPWAIELWGASRHPVQVYEILAGAIILWLAWPGKRLGMLNQAGIPFLSFGAMSAGSRLFLEAFRGDSYLLPGGIRAAQIIAWGILGICLLGIGKLSKSKQESQ